MKQPIFLFSAALLFAVGNCVDYANNIADICNSNISNDGTPIICHRTGTSKFGMNDTTVYDKPYSNTGETMCCDGGQQCLLSRKYDQVACHNPM